MLLDLFGRHRAQRRNGAFQFRSQMLRAADTKNVLGPIRARTVRCKERKGSVGASRVVLSVRVPAMAWHVARLCMLHPCLLFVRGCEYSHPRLKVSESWQHSEGNRPSWHRFRDQVDPVIRAVPKKMRGPIEMPNAIGIEAHQSRTGEVCSHGIVGQDDLSKMPMSSVQGPVSFHRDDAVRDDEVHRYCGADIEDASVDALPMQDVLRPPVLRAGD